MTTEPRPGFNTPIPESILTPDRVSTRIGELEFFDGAGGRNLDARTYFFYIATDNTPAMALKIPGVGLSRGLSRPGDPAKSKPSDGADVALSESGS